VLALPPSVKIYLASGPTDLRKSFGGLSGLARTVLDQDPVSGHLFVFCNRRRDRLRILYFDGSGLWVFAKRLEKGTFCWPDTRALPRIELRSSELTLLLGGIDLSQTKIRDWYARKTA
jgi:transposase